MSKLASKRPEVYKLGRTFFDVGNADGRRSLPQAAVFSPTRLSKMGSHDYRDIFHNETDISGCGQTLKRVRVRMYRLRGDALRGSGVETDLAPDV